MVARQKNMRIPSELVPYCPLCGAPMTMNLRADSTFVEDAGWQEASNRYENFICRHQKSSVLYLELGVGANTPGIIKYPFWKMTYQNPNAVYVCINLTETFIPLQIERRSICLKGDIGAIIKICQNI